MAKIDDNPDVITLDLPQREGAPGYMGLFLRYYSIIAAIISDARGDTDYRIVLMTDLMIASIPDEDIRTDLKTFKHTFIEDEIKKYNKKQQTKITIDEKNKIQIKACMETIGKVSEFVDLHMGVSKKLIVDVI